MSNSVTIEYEGKTYSGTYKVIGPKVVVSHHSATNRGDSGGLPAEGLAQQLLFEIVVRHKNGVPDEPA